MRLLNARHKVSHQVNYSTVMSTSAPSHSSVNYLTFNPDLTPMNNFGMAFPLWFDAFIVRWTWPLYRSSVRRRHSLFRRLTNQCHCMPLQFRGYSVSSWSSDIVAKDQDPEPRFRASARHDTRQREPRRPCVRLHVPGKFSVVWWSVSPRYTQTYRARFRSNVFPGQHLEG